MKLNRGLADTVFAWTCAIATVGFLTTAVVIGANGGGWKVTETLIWAVLIGWLLLLTGKQRGQDERIDDAVDTAVRALAAAQDEAVTQPTGIAIQHWADAVDDQPRGRHAARPTPWPRERETA